jgi:hypothetical protein
VFTVRGGHARRGEPLHGRGLEHSHLQFYLSLQLYRRFAFIPVLATIFIVVETVLIERAEALKFVSTHAVRPLHSLIHYEHHLTKGIYPSTSGFGVWELSFLGVCS